MKVSRMLDLFLKPYYSFLMMNRLKAIQHIIQKNQLYGNFIVHFWNLTYTIAKSIGTPSNERFEYFSNFHEYKS